jgi:opacity protein-like surface antigen
MAWLSGLGGINENRLGYAMGLSTDYAINANVAVKSGILYERKGSQTEITITDNYGMPLSTIDVNSNYDYLVLPMVATLSTDGKKVNAYMDMGPYFGYLLRQETVIAAINDIPEQKLDETENLKKIDMGLSFGAGIVIPANSKILFDAGIEANFGLINPNKKSVVENGSIRANSLGINIGVKYRI